MKGEVFTTLDDALHFVDTEVRHKAEYYARARPEAIPDLLQEAKIAIWRKWRQSNGRLDRDLAFVVAKDAVFNCCIRGSSVDSHILRLPQRRPNGYPAIYSLDSEHEADDDSDPGGRPGDEWAIDLLANQTRHNARGQLVELRFVEGIALTSAMLDSLDSALPDENLRTTLQLLRTGYTKAQVARMTRSHRKDITVRFRRIAAIAKRMWAGNAAHIL